MDIDRRHAMIFLSFLKNNHKQAKFSDSSTAGNKVTSVEIKGRAIADGGQLKNSIESTNSEC